MTLLYEFLCINGCNHTWQSTGNGYYLWADNPTSVPRPDGAPYYSEQQCSVCGQKRHISAAGPS
jgi:hypothetical protein